MWQWPMLAFKGWVDFIHLICLNFIKHSYYPHCCSPLLLWLRDAFESPWHCGAFGVLQNATKSSLLNVSLSANSSCQVYWGQILLGHDLVNCSQSSFKWWKEDGGNKLSVIRHHTRLAINDLYQAISELPTLRHGRQLTLITFTHTTPLIPQTSKVLNIIMYLSVRMYSFSHLFITGQCFFNLFSCFDLMHDSEEGTILGLVHRTIQIHLL